jgi:nonribosomal peptide synthetase DhbF
VRSPGSGTVGVNDNFAQLGGDSLLAAQLIVPIEQTLHIDATRLDVFAAPTVAAMAEQIEQGARAKSQARGAD